MTWLALGLALFLGIHLTRALAPNWRTGQIARMGEAGWKIRYTLMSLIGFGLILWGFSQARMNPVVLWPHIPGMKLAAASQRALDSGTGDRAFHEAKILTARFFFERELPMAAALRRQIEAGAETLMKLPAEAF